jgi:dUTPase
MLYAKEADDVMDIRESMVFPNCYDIFNQYENLVVRRLGTTVVNSKLRVVAELGEKCILTDRYGFCVTNHVEVQNVRLVDNQSIWIKLINRSNRNIIIPLGEIIAQIMLLPIDMVGR